MGKELLGRWITRGMNEELGSTPGFHPDLFFFFFFFFGLVWIARGDERNKGLNPFWTLPTSRSCYQQHAFFRSCSFWGFTLWLTSCPIHDIAIYHWFLFSLPFFFGEIVCHLSLHLSSVNWTTRCFSSKQTINQLKRARGVKFSRGIISGTVGGGFSWIRVNTQDTTRGAFYLKRQVVTLAFTPLIKLLITRKVSPFANRGVF